MQVETVFYLLFMWDLSHLLTPCSKEFQRFDALPFHPMNVANKVLDGLIASGDLFIGGKIPDAIPLHEDSNKKTYEVWGKFKCSVNEILETQKGCEITVAIWKRSSCSSWYQNRKWWMCLYRTLFEIKLKVYVKYLHELVNQYVIRFHPWPKWLLLCNETINFENDLSNEVWTEQFDQLLDCSAGPNPLLKNEKARLRAEYSTFVTNVIKAWDILKCDKVKYTQTELVHILLILTLTHC